MKENNKFLVLFWGKMIPLQGVQYIQKAAESVFKAKQERRKNLSKLSIEQKVKILVEL